MVKLVGLSGPPRSGKDTLGNLLTQMVGIRVNGKAQVLACSQPMREAVYAYLGLPYSLEHYEANKDKPIPLPNGKTTSIRMEMISMSEYHIKPRLGHAWWGQALLNRIKPDTEIVIVTDMGFPAEHDLFMETLGHENCAWFHIHRDGCSFKGDSRSYIGEGSRIYNNGDAGTEARRMMSRLLNQHHWSF